MLGELLCDFLIYLLPNMFIFKEKSNLYLLREIKTLRIKVNCAPLPPVFPLVFVIQYYFVSLYKDNSLVSGNVRLHNVNRIHRIKIFAHFTLVRFSKFLFNNSRICTHRINTCFYITFRHHPF